jgi:hypothetical protein
LAITQPKGDWLIPFVFQPSLQLIKDTLIQLKSLTDFKKVASFMCDIRSAVAIVCASIAKPLISPTLQSLSFFSQPVISIIHECCTTINQHLSTDLNNELKTISNSLEEELLNLHTTFINQLNTIQVIDNQSQLIEIVYESAKISALIPIKWPKLQTSFLRSIKDSMIKHKQLDIQISVIFDYWKPLIDDSLQLSLSLALKVQFPNLSTIK